MIEKTLERFEFFEGVLKNLIGLIFFFEIELTDGEMHGA